VTASFIGLAVVVLKVAAAMLGLVDKRLLVGLGFDSAIKDTLAEIIRKTGIAHEVAAEIISLPDDAVFDRLSKYARPFPDGGFILPSGGTDNVPSGGTAGSTQGANG
jgi:hypothetical protein